MARPRQRARLEDGLRLDLNRLVRNGFASPGRRSPAKGIRWSYVYADEVAAEGLVEADLTDDGGWLRIAVGSLDQRVALVSQPRQFGGCQWYYLCPATGKRVSVLWMPPGARRFASRHAWRLQVAYGSQFETRQGRALAAAQRIRCRLGGRFYASLDEFDPPKPKWMRQRTYEASLEKAWRYERIADERLMVLAARWAALG